MINIISKIPYTLVITGQKHNKIHIHIVGKINNDANIANIPKNAKSTRSIPFLISLFILSFI